MIFVYKKTCQTVMKNSNFSRISASTFDHLQNLHEDYFDKLMNESNGNATLPLQIKLFLFLSRKNIFDSSV